MGTNYFLQKPIANYCEHCGRSNPPERLHIGKSSMGWCFGLHVYPDQGINNYEQDWLRILWGEGTIVDEYGDTLKSNEMCAIITKRLSSKIWNSNWWAPKPFGTKLDGSRSFLPGYSSEAEFHQSNHSQRGPNGLLRHRIDHSHCIGHGSGTWDYIIGDFS